MTDGTVCSVCCITFPVTDTRLDSPYFPEEHKALGRPDAIVWMLGRHLRSGSFMVVVL